MLRCLNDGEHHAFQIVHHIVIGNAEDAVPAGYKPTIAAIIMTNSLLEIMAFAVDLDDELAGVRDEVGYVISNRTLPAKSKGSQPMSLEVAPQQGFGARHCAS